MLDHKKVIIVGCGLAGLATALVLARKKACVEVYEKTNSLSSTGAGIQISSNGLKILEDLGLSEQCWEKGVRATAIEIKDFKANKTFCKIDLALHNKENPHLMIHRSDLIEILFNACKLEGVKFIFGNKLEIKKSEYSQILQNNLETENTDVVVGADGIHSVSRKLVSDEQRPYFTGHIAWRAVIPNIDKHPNVARIYVAPGKHIVSYPVCGNKMINLGFFEEKSSWLEDGWIHKGDKEQLYHSFSGFCDEIKGLIWRIDEVFVWGLFQYPVLKTWYSGKFVLVGDSVHPTLPFMAQGANLALEDAWVLSDCLEEFREVREAFKRYQSLRYHRVRRIVELAEKNVWKYHLKNPLLRWLAHKGMYICSTLAPQIVLRQYDWIFKHDVTKKENQLSK